MTLEVTREVWVRLQCIGTLAEFEYCWTQFPDFSDSGIWRRSNPWFQFNAKLHYNSIPPVIYFHVIRFHPNWLTLSVKSWKTSAAGCLAEEEECAERRSWRQNRNTNNSPKTRPDTATGGGESTNLKFRPPFGKNWTGTHVVRLFFWGSENHLEKSLQSSSSHLPFNAFTRITARHSFVDQTDRRT